MTTSTFRFPSLGGRSGRLLAGLAIFGLLGSAAVLSGATPARADTGSFFVELDASAPTVAVGQPSTLTATTGVNVGPTPWFIDIYDKTTNTLLRACASGTSCSVNVAEGVETTHRYVAYVGAPSATAPPQALQGTSNSAFVSWTNSGITVNLTGPQVVIVNSDGRGYYTANTNVNVEDVSPSDPSVLIIYDETTGQMLGFTSVGDTYTAWTTPSEAGDYIVAFVEHYVQVQSQFFPPPAGTVEASSNVLLSRAFYG
jgi:hypothetical protein